MHLTSTKKQKKLDLKTRETHPKIRSSNTSTVCQLAKAWDGFVDVKSRDTTCHGREGWISAARPELTDTKAKELFIEVATNLLILGCQTFYFSFDVKRFSIDYVFS